MPMPRILPAGKTAALSRACLLLEQEGVSIAAEPGADVTHLLLPVPSFEADGCLKGGSDLEPLLTRLSENITVIGGNLDHPLLKDYHKIDLLQNENYLARNAAITAHCAIRLALPKLSRTVSDCPVLVIGWGRIGKCLARLLRQLDAPVTVAARKAADRAMLTALGYRAVDIGDICPEDYRLIFNTAPYLLLPQCKAEALKIDLASKPGITGADVIWARGLPGKDAPESSGKLIAETVTQYLKEVTQ